MYADNNLIHSLEHCMSHIVDSTESEQFEAPIYPDIQCKI